MLVSAVDRERLAGPDPSNGARSDGGMGEMPDLSDVPLRLVKPIYRYHQYQGATNDCGPTSVAIVVNALLGERVLEGPAVAEEMSHLAFEWRPLPHLALRRIPNWATFPWGIVGYLKRRGFRARWGVLGTLEMLERNLRSNRLTMVVIGEPWGWENRAYTGWAHVKILFGQVPGHRLLFVDPGYPCSPDSERLEHHGLFSQDEEDFTTQWKNLWRLYVEVEDVPTGS